MEVVRFCPDWSRSSLDGHRLGGWHVRGPSGRHCAFTWISALNPQRTVYVPKMLFNLSKITELISHRFEPKAVWLLRLTEGPDFKLFKKNSSVEKEMATYSSILAWKSPWTEEAGGLQSMGLHDWACVHKGRGRWVGSNKVVELKKKKEQLYRPYDVPSV